ncbi:hypothetical protein B0T12DRAFT_455899 [Alternaria alternata]|nr:hypothetical protein B0T12DRAFT_455899 [Alternaria alternata]
MVLLSLLSEVPALRFFVVVVLTTCAYIVHRQSASKPVKNFPHKTAVHEVPAESPVFEAQEASHPSKPPDTPVSANYFPSREFNYKCGFCFHTETSSYILTHDKARRGLKLLKEAGMRKLNIASGEPFLHPKFLSSRFATAKRIWVTEKWMQENSQWLDILAISCYSFNARTNVKIGRVNICNWDEDMVANIEKLAPFRWKAFQCLIIAGENDNETRKRDARKFLVTGEQWKTFCDRHKHLPCYVPEDNDSMATSYLLLDEYMRFMDKGEGMMTTSGPILDVGVPKAMEQIVWEKKSFVERGVIYDWGRADMKPAKELSCGTRLNMEELEF